MTHREYGHRDIVDKLGVKLGHTVALVPCAADLDADLVMRVIDRAGRAPDPTGEPADIVLATANDGTDVSALLQEWRSRLAPTGGIWLLTPKRGLAGYVNQSALIAHGLSAGLVDNKVCSVSDSTSAMRFVIRKRDRPPRSS